LSNSEGQPETEHYVPKFILRNFLSNPKKEQVSVFQKSTGRGFSTSISNIMAENRFHEFLIDDEWIASFEPFIGQIEDAVLPTYTQILQDRRLDGSHEQRANLACLVAFQFMRTRQLRDHFASMDVQLDATLRRRGHSLSDVKGYEELTPDRLKLQHIRFIGRQLGSITKVIAEKDFVLIGAPHGRSFYLGDHPVTLHNSSDAPPFRGNIGLGVKGIEIYMPLAADLMLAAWCPSLMRGFAEARAGQDRKTQAAALQAVMDGKISAAQMKAFIEEITSVARPLDDLLDAWRAGLPSRPTSENMDFHNSLQVSQAREFVICQKSDFTLAREMMADGTGRSGIQFRVG
jgi:hypothetical protein